ncbi:hypothetical protein KL928_004223 [Ogataea angusta]|uniref:Uncharacterized protein n=1 Tax=Pichia angusta TaxID=870730 RepID=A0AAN6DCD3_PICAN|nr:uncharacterized protein KL928_004223 [Ogataea angusta]KAG7816759.1 hypothetical protein KL928_004223 [Ogataea angusta]
MVTRGREPAAEPRAAPEGGIPRFPAAFRRQGQNTALHHRGSAAVRRNGRVLLARAVSGHLRAHAQRRPVPRNALVPVPHTVPAARRAARWGPLQPTLLARDLRRAPPRVLARRAFHGGLHGADPGAPAVARALRVLAQDGVHVVAAVQHRVRRVRARVSRARDGQTRALAHHRLLRLPDRVHERPPKRHVVSSGPGLFHAVRLDPPLPRHQPRVPGLRKRPGALRGPDSAAGQPHVRRARPQNRHRPAPPSQLPPPDPHQPDQTPLPVLT